VDHISTIDLSKLIGVTPRQISRLTTDGVIAPVGKKLWDAEKTIPAYCQFLREGRKLNQHATIGDEDEEGENAVAVRIKKTKREIRLLDLKIEAEEGRLVGRDVILDDVKTAAALIDAELKRAASDIVSQGAGLAQAALQRVVADRVNLLVNRLQIVLTPKLPPLRNAKKKANPKAKPRNSVKKRAKTKSPVQKNTD